MTKTRVPCLTLILRENMPIRRDLLDNSNCISPKAIRLPYQPTNPNPSENLEQEKFSKTL